MLVSVVVSFIIILISAAIPLVHFIAFPVSPFIAGFIGASVGDLKNEQIAYLGLFSSICLFFPLLFIMKFTNTFGDIGWLYSIITSFILSGYIWFGSTIGALIKFWTSKD
tara:strand:- start:371 stop:700 length:330 start_codon:yes stop_codon:yes gene_type:complete